MLTREETELLCRVGPGTPMGDLMRQYWLPLLYSWELQPDGPPLRVRALGEDLIAWRDSSGTPSFIAEHCPHRGASLFFGRNEESGLRCVYHGWKFDTAGQCVDMPNEPPESNFKTKVRATAYPAADHGGVIFIYMGPRSDPPEVPQFEWALVPEPQRHHQYRGVYHCNWMQALEGDIDTSHLYFLHSRLDPNAPPSHGVYHIDRSPRLEVMETEYGLLYGARRIEEDQRVYWRTTQYLMPIYALFPASEDGTVPSHIYTPIDDNHTMHWGLRWHPTTPFEGDRGLQQEMRKLPEINGMGPMREEQHGKPYARWWPVAAPDNDYLLDRDIQKHHNFTGIPTIRLQDAAMTAGMGPIMDRTREHLGTTDTMIIQSRRKLIRSARNLRERGMTPPGVDAPELYRARSCSAVLSPERDWKTALAPWHTARTDEPPTERFLAARTYRERL